MQNHSEKTENPQKNSSSLYYKQVDNCLCVLFNTNELEQLFM
jgi:hypothetical protein